MCVCVYIYIYIYIYICYGMEMNVEKTKVMRISDRLCGLVSEFLATDTEVPGSIPGATRFSE